jgi:hypothetical protein
MDILNNFKVLGNSTFKNNVTIENVAAFSEDGVQINPQGSCADIKFSKPTTFCNGASFNGSVNFSGTACFASPLNDLSVDNLYAETAKLSKIAIAENKNASSVLNIGEVNNKIGDTEQTEVITGIESVSTSLKISAPAGDITIGVKDNIVFESANKAVATFSNSEFIFTLPVKANDAVEASQLKATALHVDPLHICNGTVGFNDHVNFEGASFKSSVTFEGGVSFVIPEDAPQTLNTEINSQYNIKAPHFVGCVFNGCSLEAGDITATNFIATNADISKLNLDSAFSLSGSLINQSLSIFEVTDASCTDSSCKATFAVDGFGSEGFWNTTHTLATTKYVNDIVDNAVASLTPEGKPSKYDSVSNPSLAADQYTYTATLTNAYSEIPVMQLVDKNGTVKYADLTFNKDVSPQTVTVGLIHEEAITTTEFKLVVFGV